MNHLTKAERICSKLLVNDLFAGGNASFAAFPLRAVYMELPTDDSSKDRPAIQILVSVPKRRLHHAVDRNRMKRQVREAFRLQKHPLTHLLATQDRHLAIAFVCMADTLYDTHQIERSMAKILRRITEQYSS